LPSAFERIQKKRGKLTMLRERITKTRGLISGMSGLFAGALTAQLVSWPMLPKALFVMAITSVVILILWMALPKPKP
jgi:hypothetical protein